MAKRSTPKQQLANGRSTRRYKAFKKKSQRKIMNMVTAMLKLRKNPRYLKIQEEKANKKSDKITTVRA